VFRWLLQDSREDGEGEDNRGWDEVRGTTLIIITEEREMLKALKFLRFHSLVLLSKVD
jgi:hypothetical protein